MDITGKFPGLPDWDLQPPQTEFEYERWEPTGKLHLCNCPWGTSEVQVGTRSIIGQGNVVHFGTAAKRDEWFDANAQGLTFDIMYRGYDQTEYVVPVPFDVAMRYNYLWIEYQTATSDDNPIDYETNDGVRRVFYFVRNLISGDSAPNTTRIEVLPDYWTTFVYSITFTGLKLKRGHWAVKHSATPEEYLASPATNTKYLTTPDVEPSDAHLGKIALRQTFNGSKDGKVYAVTIWTCSTVEATAAHEVHALSNNTWIERGGGGYNIAALTLKQLQDLFDKINSDDYAHLAMAFKGMFFVGSDYITLSDEPYDMFGWSSVQAYHVGHIQAPILSDKLTLTKQMFGYPDKYAGYTKLYTSPYAYITVTTNQDAGHAANSWDVPTQAITYLQVCTNLVFSAPSFGATHKLLGVGTAESRKSEKIPMRTVDNNQSTTYYDANSNNYTWFSEFALHFGLVRTHYLYECVNYNQRAVILQNINKMYSGDAVPDDNSTSTGYSLQYRANWVPYRNQLVANSAVVANNKYALTAELANNTSADTKTGADAKNDCKYIDTSTNITNETTAAITAVNIDANSQSAQIGANATITNGIIGGVTTGVNGLVNGAASIVGGAASVVTGGVGAGVSSIAGGAASIVTGITTGVSTAAQAAVSANASIQQTTIANTAAQASSEIAITKNSDMAQLSKDVLNDKVRYSMGFADAIITNNNTARVNSTAASNDAALAQISRTKTINDAMTEQTYKVSKDNYDAAPDDYKLNNGCMIPVGSAANDYLALTGNDNVTINVNTMSDADIMRIGDEFALHGYTCDCWVYDSDGIDLNVMPVYTYWECSDIQANYYMPDEFADRIKMLLLGGIKIYTDPAQVGKGVIYQ